MKIKINTQLTGAEGKLIDPALTLKEVCINSILTPIQEDKEKTKLDKYDIFKKLRDAKIEVELKAEEIVVIKKAIGLLQPPLIMGQCFEMLEK